MERTQDSNSTVSIVTVTWNNRACLEEFLESIFNQRASADTEVILVDNGSTDGTVEYLRARSDVTLIESGGNLGYGGGANLGIAVAQHEFVVLCGTDVEFWPGSINAMAKTLDADSGLGGVSPLIYGPTDPPSIYPLFKGDPGLYYGWNYFSSFQTIFENSKLINWIHDYSPEQSTDLPWIHGCCGMFRRETLASVDGGFDGDFFLYFEDADLGRRIRNAGWGMRMVPDARILHLEAQSSSQISAVTRVAFMESWHRYHRKHSSALFRFEAYFVVLFALAVQYAIQSVKLLLGRKPNYKANNIYLRTHLAALGNRHKARSSKPGSSAKPVPSSALSKPPQAVR